MQGFVLGKSGKVGVWRLGPCREGHGAKPPEAEERNAFRVFVKAFLWISIVQEAQLSRRDPRKALCQLKSWPTVVQITQTDRVLVQGALSTTATFYSPTCTVLYTHHSTIAQRACYMLWVSSTNPRTTSLVLVDVNWTTHVIIRFDYNQSCWRLSVFLRQRFVMDADDRGGWT